LVILVLTANKAREVTQVCQACPDPRECQVPRVTEATAETLDCLELDQKAHRE